MYQRVNRTNSNELKKNIINVGNVHCPKCVELFPAQKI